MCGGGRCEAGFWISAFRWGRGECVVSVFAAVVVEAITL